ncbi:hypothetical protein LINGRAHAP2_LOCUS8837 [Linum grandiflorum]
MFRTLRQRRNQVQSFFMGDERHSRARIQNVQVRRV